MLIRWSLLICSWTIHVSYPLTYYVYCNFFCIELFILCHLFGGIPYIFLTLIGGQFFVANIFSRHLQGRLTAGQSSYDDEFASYTSFLSLLPRDVWVMALVLSGHSKFRIGLTLWLVLGQPRVAKSRDRGPYSAWVWSSPQLSHTAYWTPWRTRPVFSEMRWCSAHIWARLHVEAILSHVGRTGLEKHSWVSRISDLLIADSVF